MAVEGDLLRSTASERMLSCLELFVIMLIMKIIKSG